MAIRDVVVFIYLPGELEAVPAGRFRHDDALGVGEFAYGRQYLNRPNAQAVDPVDCPLTRAIAPTRLQGGLYGAFRDAAPDSWGRLVLARAQKRDPEQISEIDYLLEGGQSRVGCLDFRERPDSPEAVTHVPRIAQLDSLIDAARRIEEGLPVTADENDLLLQGSPMGGARPKCVVEHEGELWLAKFPSRRDRFNNPQVEYATMTLASACGLNVAATRLETLGDGRNVLLVKRFDRTAVAGGYTRNGFVSALTLLNVDESDHAAWSYRALAGASRRLVEDLSDLAELYRRVVFNVACRNIDDHPRNHGFLFGARGLRLSPAYDVTPAAATTGLHTDFNLAMTIGDEGPAATVSNLLSASPHFGLRRDEALQIIVDIGRGVQNWEEHFTQAGVTELDLQKFTGTFVRASDMAAAIDAMDDQDDAHAEPVAQPASR